MGVGGVHYRSRKLLLLLGPHTRHRRCETSVDVGRQTARTSHNVEVATWCGGESQFEGILRLEFVEEERAPPLPPCFLPSCVWRFGPAEP